MIAVNNFIKDKPLVVDNLDSIPFFNRYIRKGQEGMQFNQNVSFNKPYQPVYVPSSINSNVIKYSYDNSRVNGEDLGIDHISDSGLPVAQANTPEVDFNRDKQNYNQQPTQQQGTQQQPEQPTVSEGGVSTFEVGSIPSNILSKLNNVKRLDMRDIQNAVKTVWYLVNKGGFSKVQAVAQVGVYLDENRCRPESYMKAEKAGNGSSFATGGNGNKYGAGIASLTGSTKFHYLEAAGLPDTTKVENMSLEQQCDMIIKATRSSKYSPYFNILRQCKNLEEASATSFFITSGIGGWQNGRWSSPPTLQAARQRAEAVGNANDRRYGYSKYHHGGFDRRYNMAKALLKLIDYLEQNKK